MSFIGRGFGRQYTYADSNAVHVGIYRQYWFLKIEKKKQSSRFRAYAGQAREPG
jgi:hypothetical protein